MKSFRREISLIFLYCFAFGISVNIFKMQDELKTNKDLMDMTDGTMYDLGIFQIWTGIFIYFSMGLLVYLILIGWLELFKMLLFSQQIIVHICITIMLYVIFIQNPTPQRVETMLKNAMSGYGNDSYVTDVMDTTQTLLKCCGVNGYYDWNAHTNLPYSLTYVLENGTLAIVPVSCAIISEENVDLLTEGCLPSLYAFLKNIVQFLIFNALVLIICELIILFIAYVSYSDCKESHVEADSMSTEVEDVYAPMTVEELILRM